MNARFSILFYLSVEMKTQNQKLKKKVTLIGDYSQVTWKLLIYSK